ncbi:sensor histidine kinase [Novosphingobium flavum]|uniref:histidine kinase n=2 Tax=Novosphingobium flavum TaxID=1778672 RepID=A0A7X1FR17_9SPHN|nr:ATP-binding protein [Novosphingobium flavum]MBC2664952.1 sensor histidine kinase [Novosphingobium flavum]
MTIAILLLRSQMLQVIEGDRARQIADLRDDLVTAYYDGGREGLARQLAERRGALADPLVFAAVTGGPGAAPPVLVNLARLPGLGPTDRPVALPVVREGHVQPTDGVALATEMSDGSRLVVGTLTAPDRSFDLAFAEAFTLTLVLTIVMSLAGALGIGWVISRRTHAIAETAAALASGDFAARVRSEDTADGFDHLSRQINLMAERIDALVTELKSISGALAHDLRSPVARLRAAIDTATEAAPDGPAGEALALARADAEALETMLTGALDLARVESGALHDRRVRLDLGEVAADLVELYEPLAEQAGKELTVTGGPAFALADRELISRALANLIDNALKYGGNRIAVSVGVAEPDLILAVADDGPGIAAQDRPRVVERFTRLDHSRGAPGTGLGLAMVTAVARLHGGVLELSDAGESPGGRGGKMGGGLVARLRLPSCA